VFYGQDFPSKHSEFQASGFPLEQIPTTYGKQKHLASPRLDAFWFLVSKSWRGKEAVLRNWGRHSARTDAFALRTGAEVSWGRQGCWQGKFVRVLHCLGFGFVLSCLRQFGHCRIVLRRNTQHTTHNDEKRCMSCPTTASRESMSPHNERLTKASSGHNRMM
jgi:hypothetical protein